MPQPITYWTLNIWDLITCSNLVCVRIYNIQGDALFHIFHDLSTSAILQNSYHCPELSE